MFFSGYNVERVDLGGEYNSLGIKLPPNSVTNFFPLYLHVRKFLEYHDFMRKEFREKYGYDFGVFIQTLAAMSSFTILPQKAIFAESDAERESIKVSAFIQTLTRGYHLFVGSQDVLVNMLLERMELLFGADFEAEDVRKVLASVTLSEERQSKISAWSNGPRSILIPGDGVQIMDLVSIPSLLRTLFVFMSDEYGSSGTVFEQLFGDALERRGFTVVSGVLVANCGAKRELDAGVIIEGKLYIFECVSIEMPLDYEIGRPRTMAKRKERLQRKLDQAKSMRSFVESNPSGKNYDFSDVNSVEYAVVSPFVEWIWSMNNELWIEADLPRILSPEEVFTFLEGEP